MSLGRTTPRLAVAALLAATAAAAAPAQAETTTTDLLVQVPAVVGQLTLSATSGSVTPTATRQSDGSVLVAADLPEVAVSDSRADKPGWSYSVSLPATLTSATDSAVAVQHSDARVQVPTVPVIDPVLGVATGQTRKEGWQPFSQGTVAGLVTAAPNAASSNATFVPQLKLTLPASTAAGQYRAVVTHSVV